MRTEGLKALAEYERTGDFGAVLGVPSGVLKAARKEGKAIPRPRCRPTIYQAAS